MIMMGLKFMGDVPFRDVYIHGLIRDHDGQKMSKSKGNVLDPLDIIDGVDLDTLVTKRTTGMMQDHLRTKIEKATRKEFPDGIGRFGADALRFTYAALATTGRDIRFDLGRIEGYRNFCNKLWNAARFVLMQTENKAVQAASSPGPIDRWILSRMNRMVAEVENQMADYRLDLAAQALYEFTWNEYCDWYLELSKTVLNDENSTEAARRGTRKTLVTVLETLLRLAHPVIPFITEEIWQQVGPLAGVKGKTIMQQPWPVAEESLLDTYTEDEMRWVMQFILGIRKIKGEMNISPGKQVPVLLSQCTPIDEQRAIDHRAYLDFLARTESINVLYESDDEPESAITLVGDMRVLIPMAGLIDKDAELKRLEKEIGRFDGEIERLEKKLSNKGFVDKAPGAVVQKEREKLVDAEKALANLQAQIMKIRQL